VFEEDAMSTQVVTSIYDIDPGWDARSEADKAAMRAGVLSASDRKMQVWGLPTHWRKAGPFDWTGCDDVVVMPGRLSGVPTVGESRFSADNLLELYESGMSARELAAGYLLDLQKVVAVLRFALAHGAVSNGTEPLEDVWRELDRDAMQACLKTPIVSWSGCEFVESSLEVNAGNPTVIGSTVLADDVVELFDSGETVQSIAEDESLPASTVEELLGFAGRLHKVAA
jgi:uncharacterized protein (DUF433 family)